MAARRPSLCPAARHGNRGHRPPAPDDSKIHTHLTGSESRPVHPHQPGGRRGRAEGKIREGREKECRERKSGERERERETEREGEEEAVYSRKTACGVNSPNPFVTHCNA